MIGRDDVHVWTATVTDLRPDLPALLGLLGDDERRRAEAHRTGAGRDRFIAAHGLCRTVLGDVLGRVAADLVIVAPPGRRPRVVESDGGDVRFSLAHAGDVVAVALAIGVDIGVDVEEVAPHRMDLAVARRFLSPDDVAGLIDLPPVARPRAFARAWTRLEAEAKGAGHPLEAARRRARVGVLRELRVAPGHVATLWMPRPATVIEHTPALLASVA